MSTNKQDGIDRAADDRLVAASVTAIEEACARAGFRVAVDNDMFALRRYLQACGAYDNPSFDPNEHDLSRDAFWLRAEDAFARQVGITGVPCFIVDRKFAISGAQPPEAFIEIFEAARRESDAPEAETA